MYFNLAKWILIISIGLMNPLTIINVSLSGKYWENGAYYYASGGSYSMRSDGKYFHHFYANLGNMVEEVTAEAFTNAVNDMNARNGKKHPTYGCEMNLYITSRQTDSHGY